MKQIYAFFKSVRLAVVLLSILALSSIFSTLIPQGREAAYYAANYSRLVSNTILVFQLNSFFSSYLFIATVLLFTINLSVCTASRLVREFTGKRKRRFGPDLIHVGLLILIVGGLVTFLGRREAFFYLAEGEEVQVAGKYVVRLETYEFLTYEDGQPKDWVSTVDVIEDGELVIDDYRIEVNNPLGIGRVDLFQASYGNRERVVIIDDGGNTHTMDVGSYFTLGSDIMLFSGVALDPKAPGGYVAQFQEWENRRVTGVHVVGRGEKLGGYTVGKIEVREVTGIQAVTDPGYLPALIGFILCVVGLTLTYAQKIGDKEI